MQQVTLLICDVLCVCEKASDEALAWLDESEERYLIIFGGEEKSVHPRVRMCEKDEASIKKIVWELVFLHFEFLPQNAEEESFFAKVAKIHEGVHLVASDFQGKGIDRLKNLMVNSALFSGALDARGLFGAFSNIPAIICGAGSSLEKQMPYLKTLQGRALLFAGGTALSSLSQMGIQPHFGGIIDPHPPSSRFFQHSSFEVPTFFQNRAHPDKLRQMQGALLWMPGSENDLFEEEVFEGGWNISTYLAALACHLGCNPIILVGVDLAQSKEKAYAGGFERSELGELIEVEEGIFSRKDWIVAGDWLGTFVKKHPEVEWINASSGLLIENFSQKNLCEMAFESQEDLMGKIHSAIQGLPKGVMPQFERQRVRESFFRVGELANKMLALLEKLYPSAPEKNGEYTLLGFELEKEEAYEQFFQKVWQIWRPVFARKVPEGIPPSYGIDLNKWLFIKGICDEAREI